MYATLTKRAILFVSAFALVVPVALGARHPKARAPKPDTALGAALFVENCGGCHTFRAAGSDAIVGPNLNLYPPPSLAYVKFQITHGGGVMPAFTRFSAQQVADIAAFVWTKS